MTRKSTPPASETPARLRVSYGETDKLGIVYYANYLRWFEVGRAEYLRARGRSYKELEGEGIFMPVVEAYVRYRSPATYDDQLVVWTSLKEAGPVRLSFTYRVVRESDGHLLAEGHTTHACIDEKGQLRRLPATLRKVVESAPA